FARQAIPMIWDFSEANPFSNSSGSWEILANNTARSMSGGLFDFHRAMPGAASQADACKQDLSGAVLSTDPPYYDNIGYADLADFFYVWLRRSLRTVYPEL